ncbi:MAG: biopolymer transporter ExbD [Prevotella sp.]|nr:biopolymer transporter ExbD [Prevotella sp.]MBQ8628493.1 biopolymer transporter ExbD [Prevotella sp.]
MDMQTSGGKKGNSKQKKMNVRVDFTPMVDMMMLLITFFMLCTSLSKPQTMQLTMPSNDKNVQEQDKNAAKASQTITIYVGADDKIYYVAGLPNYEDPNCMKETTWGKDGIRKVLIEHVTEEGINPVAKIMNAKAELDRKKIADPKKFTDQEYEAELAKIRDGNVNGEKIPTLTIIIKATDNSSYKNLVDALDEMQICTIGKYVIDKITPEDEGLLKKKGVK